MNILVVSNYYYPEHAGGVEVVSYNLVKYYRTFGESVRWMAADVAPKFREVADDDVPIRAWNIAEEKLGFPHPLPSLKQLPAVWSSVRWCDVVHLQDSLYSINIIVFLFAKLCRKPILITQYAKNIPYEQVYKRVLQWLAYRTIGWLMLNSADRVAFITETVRSAMAYLTPNIKQEVLPLGVDTDFYKPVSQILRNQLRERLTGDSATPIILFVGRLVERKGVHLIRPLVEKHQEWHWVLVGRPDDFNPAEWCASNLSYFEYASEQNLRELYASADLLVHPSVGEGITLIASESLASGTPVVISAQSLYEVDDKDRDLFIAVQPETGSIEEVLVRVLVDGQRLAALRANCRDYALNRLSWKAMVEQYLSILRRLVQKQ